MDTVVAALDVTGCAGEVTVVAERLAKALGARLVLFSTWQLPSSVPRGLRVAGDTAAHTLEVDLQAHLEVLAAGAKAQRIPVEVVVREGAPVDAILGSLDELGATWLVMGTHARTGLARMVLGSVAEQVIRHSPVPVVTVRAKHPEAHPGLSEAQIAVAAEGDG